MKERPILFSGPMVRAILEGRKTQTRRVVKWRDVRPGLNLQFSGLTASAIGDAWVLESPTRASHEWRCAPTQCPHGHIGDRLWVRETHLNWWKLDEANPEGPRVFSHVAAYAADGYELEPGEKWIPSIHMLRAASRITLEITGVRVERLQDISETDARAEGVTIEDRHNMGYCAGADRPPSIRAFRELWDGLNAARGHGWDANPWVWVIEFRRAAPTNNGE
ncbi:conserved protein of unknown function [Burkholderia multivorans]